MNTNYKCSIFCSFYKGEKFIEGYIKDMLKQTIFDDIEFIFLDCNSPENEKDFIIPIADKFDNVNYYSLEKDPGLYAAWNRAVFLCSSNIIGNWNIDDRKPANSLEILLKEFTRTPNVDVVYGITYISEIANETYEDNDYSKVYPCLPHSLQNLFNNNSPHCMPLWKKDLHDRFGPFDENMYSAADGDFWLRCACRGAIIKMINHPVGLYYHNPNGRSTNPEHLTKAIAEVQKNRQMHLNYLRSLKTQ